MLLLGRYEHSLDAKNRVTLPAALRRHFDKTLILSIGVDKCIELRTPQDFQAYANTLKKYGTTKEKYRNMLRTILGNSYETQIDGSNRVLLPLIVINDCKIKKNVVIIGVGDKIEIWDSDVYNEEKRISDINALSNVLESVDDEVHE